MKLFMFTVLLILFSSCATYKDVEHRENNNVSSVFYFQDPMFFYDSFYQWKGYNVYFNKPDYHWSPIINKK